MKKTVFIPLLVLMLALVACRFAQQNLPDLPLQRVELTGRTQTEERPVSGFDKIQLSGAGNLDVAIGESESLTIKADEALLPYIITEVRNGTLIIRFEERKTFTELSDIQYAVTAKSLQGLELSGLGSIQVPSLQTDTMKVLMSGAGSVTLGQLAAERLEATLSGLGNLTASGQVQELQVDMSGAGNLEAGDLESQTAVITMSGLGSATVWATESLEATLSAAGSLKYYGTPTVKENITGIGKIESLGEKP